MKNFLAKAWRTLGLPRGIQLFIMRFFQDQFLVGVTGIVFNDRNEILVFKHTYRQDKWSLPGGYIKSKEHPFEALEREIQEESGLIVSVEDQLKLRTDRESPRLDLTLVAKFIGGDFKPSHEVSEYGFFTFDNLPLLSKNQLLQIKQAQQSKGL